MIARYEKTIVVSEPIPQGDESEEVGGSVKCVVIFDEKLHTPVIYGVNKYGMDEMLELLGGHNVVQ